ncbi:MAG: protein-(glutamine-N5) methyltransferase, release factor-specific [Pelagibacteraceae bacterium BACL5 MAG-120705-bin12]|jgi:release factor glutamine methyltransferase|nr:MAG: protein-(glutamine-N5) methyltransferase, release factor-specific [Pelagibacteraceae bacterium BACL5 MAG-121015-bin10]KRO60317.1 MAG: protein-(glutamine-N5) methyltransferase, release factor-specific [Pelagibacteraceae bacterium BACL5 MAG-120705-bin12]KRO61387.1 MAG: protein-(glutamine-N5) methyltransferase, release factor-specific [Pelagibacteraceae bacterium BACL5 MAG-121128-bin54]MDA1166856.1 peptide chain release factor N(5)-glutamine methyltransferase [Pseudomonadota bacterium]
MNIENALNIANNILKDNCNNSYQLDSELLMSKIFEKDRKFIILNSNKKLSEEKLEQFNCLINKRLKGEPIAYLLKKKDFWKYEFYVDKGILIPRPDSEVVVDQILKLTNNKDNLRILDIGVGSGCLLLSVLKERKKFHGVGVDISKKCIDISNINASKLKISNRVKFFKSDVDNFNFGKYDLIVSNPPYIKMLDFNNLKKDVINFEPKLALYGGLDGTSEIRKVIKKSSELIKKNGKFILEIAYDQKNKVIKLLRDKGFYINNVLKDLADNDRCIVSTKV